MSQNLMTASRQWMSRPYDERFLTLEDLHRSVISRKRESWTVAPQLKDLRMLYHGMDGADEVAPEGLAIQVYDPTQGQKRLLAPTHWAFNQLCTYIREPAALLRELPPPLAVPLMQWGLEMRAVRDDGLLLAQSNGSDEMRSLTSPSYGRIWDVEVVEAVQKANADGRWQVPAASYATRNPLRATTLYGSKQDVFMFMVDPKNPVHVGGEDMFRGFMVWNSEVGSAVFGLTTFLYRFICDNRIIWGATEIKELRIRHTSGAPERFAYEGQKFLRRYAEESTVKLVEGIQRAQATEVPLDKHKNKTVEEWLANRGFTKAQAKASVDTAKAEEGDAHTIWQVVQGVTAFARSVPNASDRVELETRAGKILADVAA